MINFSRPLASRFSRRCARAQVSVRNLELHECHAKELLNRHNVRVQRGLIAETWEQAQENAVELRKLGARDLICKSQILAGGRGKGTFDTGFKGGVKVCESPEEVGAMAKEMIGNWLTTKQTPPGGQLVQKVLIHEGVDFEREYYFAILLERAYDGPVLVGSPMGGMDVEEVAENHPEQLKMIPVDVKEGVTDAQVDEMARFMGFEGDAIEDAKEQMKGLYDVFSKNDCVQIEINPMVQTTKAHYDSKVYCVDAKLGFDESTAYRNKEIFSWKDESMLDPREVEAEKVGLNYVGLDGNIGCMVNGAGLAMGTMDTIALYGGEPANFLDVGGSATEEQVELAFNVLTSDPKVRCILVNIFGGIMKCDTIAKGVISAAKKIDLQAKGIPLVVRLAGTNVDLGKQLLNESGILIQVADDLDDAARKAALVVC